MPQPDDWSRDFESAMGGMTLDSASLTGTGEQDIEDMEKNPDVKTEEGGVNKEWSWKRTIETKCQTMNYVRSSVEHK